MVILCECRCLCVMGQVRSPYHLLTKWADPFHFQEVPKQLGPVDEILMQKALGLLLDLVHVKSWNT